MQSCVHTNEVEQTVGRKRKVVVGYLKEGKAPQRSSVPYTFADTIFEVNRDGSKGVERYGREREKEGREKEGT